MKTVLYFSQSESNKTLFPLKGKEHEDDDDDDGSGSSGSGDDSVIKQLQLNNIGLDWVWQSN